jgi:hypothetical protein
MENGKFLMMTRRMVGVAGEPESGKVKARAVVWRQRARLLFKSGQRFGHHPTSDLPARSIHSRGLARTGDIAVVSTHCAFLELEPNSGAFPARHRGGGPWTAAADPLLPVAMTPPMAAMPGIVVVASRIIN